MDSYSSGEEPVVKTRKPYTITKQRERWTEEEHSRFLEALKLYGRAWQRIEEHIGSKTAVQIRSHAQKFFTKMEREALMKGVPISKALNIEIPPPRPKRKPVNPYPRNRKTVACNLVGKDRKSSAEDSSLCQSKQPILEKPSDDENLDIAKENREEVISDMLTLFQAGATSPSPRDKDSDPTKATTFRGFVPIQEDGNKSCVTTEVSEKLNTKPPFQDGSPGGIIRRYPRHVPVHILEESSCTDTKDSHHLHHDLPSFYPQFSRLIVSALLQNPAAHAAATSAASSLWPPQAPTDSALAAATVAAATSWWAAHGLLPISPPFHNPIVTYPTPSKTETSERKPVDRSSCGSNTPSSSEIETDAFEKDKQESGNRRNDTWKEVSEEGRIAFQALFSREELPQSFFGGGNMLKLKLGEEKLKTGFKPYKRCSMEAKESYHQEEEKVGKRLRQGGGEESATT